MGNVQVLSPNSSNDGSLTDFQKNKLIFDFNTFFDLNNDGYLSYKDFQWAKDRICQMSGWKVDCAKYKSTEKLFTAIWTSLVQVADTDHDGKITSNEWLAMWEAYKKELIEREKEMENFLEKFYSKHDPDFKKLKSLGTHLGEHTEIVAKEVEHQKWAKFEEAKHIEALERTILPDWLYDYLRFRFDLLDRVGDGIIDTEEYEYVLSEFHIKEKDSRQAFLLFSHHLTVEIDFPYFVKLFEEYYLSDNPADLGNFVNGKLDFTATEEPNEEEVLTEEQKIINQFDLSMYKDDMMSPDDPEKGKNDEEKKAICANVRARMWKLKKRLWKSFKLNCLQSNAL